MKNPILHDYQGYDEARDIFFAGVETDDYCQGAVAISRISALDARLRLREMLDMVPIGESAQ